MLVIDDKIKASGEYMSMDNPTDCLDKHHFNNYKKVISYDYNSRGFRDNEWPEDLSEVVWCLGDSFTVGIGQPQSETWPAILEKKIKKRCLNLGEDGCSNDTIALRTKNIVDQFNPSLIVVMWSYFHRRRVNGNDVQHDKTDFGDQEDMENFFQNFESINLLPTKIVHFVIPNAFTEEKNKIIKQKYQDIIFLKNLDYARDGHHFDIKTSNIIAEYTQRRFFR